MAEKKERFDLTVTHRNPKTGLITHQDPYILRQFDHPELGRIKAFERPKGSGNLFDRDNNPMGRWEREETVHLGKTIYGGKFVKDAPHIEWNPPETQDQIVARENAALKAELAAMKAEAAKKTGSGKKDQGA